MSSLFGAFSDAENDADAASKSSADTGADSEGNSNDNDGSDKDAANANSENDAPTTPVAAEKSTIPVSSPIPEVPTTMTSSDMDTAVRYLSSGRAYVPTDRANKEYMWSINVQQKRSTGTGAGGDSKFTTRMQLQWKKVSSSSSYQGSLPVGNVDLEDLKNISYDALSTRGSTKNGTRTGLVVTLQLKNSTRALKSCGGRTKLVLQGFQIQETKKFHMCLRNLWLIASKQSRLVQDEEVNEDEE